MHTKGHSVSEAAQPINVDLISTDGLEPLFEATELGSETENQAVEPGSEPISGSAQEIVSTDEAARRLGISSRAVIKRLQTGALQGFRDTTKTRSEWRIYWKEPSSEPTNKSKNIQTEPERTSTEERTASKEPNRTGSDSYLIELNKKLLEQVQALTYRNGYLQSQLTEREQDIAEQNEQIKLLTDSQHKSGWWARFSSWFMTGR